MRINDDAYRKRWWLMVDAERKATEKTLLRTIRSMYEKLRKEALRKLRSTTITTGTSTEDLTSSIFSIRDANGLVDDDFRPVEVRVIADGFRSAFKSINLTAGAFNDRDPRFLSTLENVIGKTKGSNVTLSQRLARHLATPLAQGASIDELAAVVQAEFRGQSAGRARVIAQTAATAGFEMGQQIGYEDAGVQVLQWLTQRDGIVRPSHADADGQEQPVGSGFEVGTSNLLFPGDPSGPADEVINCRCTVIPVI